ncbi:uncharacterized protein [Nicotiana sylvestris]
MVKFEYEDREIVVHGEDEQSIYRGLSIPCLEAREGSEHTVYQAFEVVLAEQYEEGIPCPQHFLSHASIMVAKEMIRQGFKPGKGLGKSLQGITEPITLPSTKKLFGIGFQPTLKDEDWAKKRKNKGWKPKYIEEEDDEAFTAEEIEEICGAIREMLYETHMVQLGEGTSTAEKQRKFKTDISDKIKEEITKQLKIGVIRVVQYTTWLANVVPVLMDEEDAEKTAFTTPWGTYRYRIMPFGLKNDGATYMRVMTAIFHDMIHQEIEVYVDDVIVKSRNQDDHVRDMRKFFERLRKYDLKLNPAKCAFGVPSGKLLGFIVRRRDEEINTIEVVSEDAHAWKMFFDGAINAKGVGIGAILILPASQHYSATARLRFFCTNNTAEYEACIMGMNMAVDQGVEDLLIMGDSDLIIRQAQGKWETRDIKLIPYRQHVEDLGKRFKSIEFRYIPRCHNELADALATLASMLPYPSNADIGPLEVQIRERHGYYNVIEAGPSIQPWYQDVKRFLKTQEYPEHATGDEKRTIRQHASGFFLRREVLYKRTPDLNLLRCVDAEEAGRIMHEVHAGVCGPHMNEYVLAKKILRAGYYWITMDNDCFNVVRKCHQCQVHGDLIHASPTELHPMSAPWPFVAWDNAANLNSRLMEDICEQFKITHSNSTPYRPKANGVVEAANKNIKKILRKTIQSSREWHEQLPFALLGYRTTVCTSAGATLYLLVYGTEAVIPVEVEIPSLRTIVEAEIEDSEWEAKGKFAPNWKGPYIIRKILPRGALYLGDIEGNDPETAMNADAVKMYYV